MRWYGDIKTKVYGVLDGSEMERGVKDRPRTPQSQ